MNRHALLFVVFVLSACGASLEAASSGKIGCPQSEIRIEDDSSSEGVRTWTATCRGNRYYCSATHVSKGSSDFSCTQELNDEPSYTQGLTDPDIPRGCDPECSPGFACRGSTCVPQCNPPCGAGMWCGGDRTCHAGAATPDGATPAPPPCPDKLSKADVKAGMGPIRGYVASCADASTVGGNAVVTFSILGDGTVGSTSVSGSFAGTPIADCIEKAVKTAQFRTSSCEPMTVSYPFKFR